MTTIGQNIRKLRRERGLTQEELAARLNITSQAVSKWEMETCSPDISQIIPLATLFGVSADVLFGISPDAMENEIEETKKYCAFPEITNEQAMEAWRKLYERYPHNCHILFEIATLHEYLASETGESESTEHYRNAAACYAKILDGSTDNTLRGRTIVQLHHVYHMLGEWENMLRVANMGGEFGTLKAEMLSKIDGYEKKNYWRQEIFRYYGERMAWVLMDMEFSERETKIFAAETAVKILDLVYCDGNRAWASYIYMALYTDLAKLYACAGDEEKMYDTLDKWYDVAVFEDNLPLGDYRYLTNPFLNEITYRHDLAYTHNQRDYILWHLKDYDFDSVRGSERFRAYVEKVRVMPGLEYPFGGVDFE